MVIFSFGGVPSSGYKRNRGGFVIMMGRNRKAHPRPTNNISLCPWHNGRHRKRDCRCRYGILCRKGPPPSRKVPLPPPGRSYLTQIPQPVKDAMHFYTTKIDELTTNLKDLEAIIQGKSNNLRVVEDGENTQNISSIAWRNN